MKKYCAICRRRIYFWNGFYRRYGFAKIFNKKTFANEGIIYFCSMECYEKTLNIEQKKSKNFFKNFYKHNEEWIELESKILQ